MGRNVTEEELSFIRQEGEGLRVEFKESVSASLAREFVAFANASGGRVFLGIRDDGVITGATLDNRLRSRIQDIANNCTPPVAIRFEALEDIVLIHVPEGADKPYHCADGFFLRTGSNSQKLDREQIVAFLQAEGLVRFEEQHHRRFDFDRHYDASKLDGYLRMAGITRNLDDRTILENLGVGFAGPDAFQLNVAGILFFSKAIPLLCEQATITCAVFEGTERIQVANRKDYAEGIISNIDNAMRFVRQELRVRYEMTGEPRRREVYEVPLEAIREALVNAVSHRDYAVYGAHTVVELFDDRLEISSPGGLVKGLTPETFGMKAIRRNQLIASLLHRVGLVENMGTGINKIRGLLADAGCPEALFTFNEFFTTVFPRSQKHTDGWVKTSGKTSVKTSGKILQLITTDAYTTIPEMAKAIGVTVRSVERNLATLQRTGRLRRVGPAKGGHWEVLDGGHHQ